MNFVDLINPKVIIRKSTSKPLRRIFITLIFQSVIYIVLILFSSSQENLLIVVANILGPLCLMIIVNLMLYISIRRHVAMIWTPYSFYLLNIIIYSGLGPLVFNLGNEATISKLQSGHFYLTQYELLRTNLLNVIGIASAIFGFYFFSRIRFSRIRIGQKHNLKLLAYPKPNLSLETLSLIFLVIGGLLRYFVFLPFQFGLTNFVLPGVIFNLQYLFVFGLAISAYLAATKKRKWLYIFWTLLLTHLLTVSLEFNKSNMMLAIIIPALGEYLALKNLKRLAIWGIAAAIIFSAMNPLVLTARGEIFGNTGNIEQATLPERLNILSNVLEDGGATVAFDENAEQKGWSRIAFSGVQAFAMRQRDSGIVYDTFSDIWVVFIPRLLWPNKPVGISPGRAFYKFVTSYENNTSVGITVYADAYWNQGWLGVVWVSAFMGMTYALMSRWTVHWLQTKQFIFLPVITLGIQSALLGPNKWVINGVFGILPIYLAYMLAILIIMKFLRVRS
jgi:hypothetical protein